jgi:maltose alpha-D-glucosyltransferase/alpha-amylase
VLGSVPRDRLEPISLLRGEQSNTSIRFGDSLILKLFRRLEYGPNPDVEVGLFLTEHTTFRGTPPVAGTLEYVSPDRGSASVALLQGFEPNRGDAWTTTLARVREVVDGNTSIIASVSALGQLGETTAHLHLALASGSGDFGPEPITARDIETWRTAIHQEVRAAAEALHQRGLPVDVDALLQRADGIDALAGSLKARHHGDYHLGQVLERPDGSFVIIDFEGEPAKPLVLRREKRSPLRDVAGMLRSFDYARHAAGREAPRAEEWYRAARAAFLGGYTASIAAYPGLVPPMLEAPLAALELEKAAYEALYELNNRPDWIAIPLAALRTRG